jgi:hypothetical protein
MHALSSSSTLKLTETFAVAPEPDISYRLTNFTRNWVGISFARTDSAHFPEDAFS